MIKIITKACLTVITIFVLVACGGNEHKDLEEYIVQTKRKSPGKIPPIPPIVQYEAFIYSAAGIRSPFDKPIDIKIRLLAKARENLTPDFNRIKEYLERFDLNSLKMVGTLQQGETLWALVSDQTGGLHRVATGNYLGKNHGRIVETTETKIELIEIVSDGHDGWLERPRILALIEKE